MSEPNIQESSTNETVKTETVVVAVLGTLFVLFMIFVLFWDDGLGTQPATGSPPPVSEFTDDWNPNSNYEETIQVGGYSPSGGSGMGNGTSPGVNRELYTAVGLKGELKRIIRAGRRLEALRNSNNLTLTRRCLSVSQELKSQADDLRSKGLNIPFPAGTVSLDDVIRQAMLCISCAKDARQYCVLAAQNLDLAVK